MSHHQLVVVSENILLIHNEEGYNLLQKCVGINNLEMVRWCISRNIDINRGCCSLPLHIGKYGGYGAEMILMRRLCFDQIILL